MPKIIKIGIYYETGVESGKVKVMEKNDVRSKNEINNYLSPDIIERAKEEPLNWTFRNWWLFKGIIYWVDSLYSEEQGKLLVYSEVDKERKLFEKLKQKYQTENEFRNNKRESIPENVRILVWRRDGGKCVRCGSREKLEYDHIIPVSKGGSNTARNIELLCESCNRKKGANIE